MKIAITGGTGFIGSKIVSFFKQQAHEIIFISRMDIMAGDGHLKKMLEEVEILINLAGAPILKRWTKTNKQIIYDSRIITTKKILNALNTDKTKLIISASAIGIYSSNGKHTEAEYKYADDFLAKVCSNWEQGALVLSDKIRTVIFRFGVVLGDGGALKKMIPLFKSGLGGRIGNGRQAYSWVHIEDVIKALTFVIENKNCNGIYNMTAPNPTTNKEFTNVLAGLLKRSAIFSIPGFLLKLIYGAGSAVLTGGQYALPQRLQHEGYVFSFPELKDALRNSIIKKK